MRPLAAILACASALLLPAPALAQDKDKKEEKKKEPPQIIMSTPLAVAPNQKVTISLRGLKLDNITVIRLGEGDKKVDATIKNKGGAKPPDKYEAKTVGDTKADIEFTLPADITEKISITAVNADGESKPYELRIIPADKLVQEKEPNDGFKDAQPIAPGKTVAGMIQGNNQVDVFAYAAKKGEKITIEVFARRLGSAMDPSLELFDPTKNKVAFVDDLPNKPDPDKRDPILTFTASMDGIYLIILQDAMDRGDSTHPYLLQLTTGVGP